MFNFKIFKIDLQVKGFPNCPPPRQMNKNDLEHQFHQPDIFRDKLPGLIGESSVRLRSR